MIDLYLAYNKVLKKLFFWTRWRNTCTNRRQCFRKVSGACSRTVVHFHLEQKIKFFL